MARGYFASKTIGDIGTEIHKSSLVCAECFRGRQPIIKQFTVRALLGVINTRDPYQGRGDLLSERENIISYDVNKHLCRRLHISRFLIGEQSKRRRCCRQFSGCWMHSSYGVNVHCFGWKIVRRWWNNADYHFWWSDLYVFNCCFVLLPVRGAAHVDRIQAADMLTSIQL